MAEPTNWFEHHVVTTLERLEKGQTEFVTKFQEHADKDAQQFEAIRVDLATSRATHEAVAKTSAKFWAAIATGISLIGSTAIHFFTKGR